jgi:predicted dithiol-disulfide oxidoreductase (DUF899 family)
MEHIAMSYKETSERIADYRRQIEALRAKIREARSAVEPEEVSDYEFSTVDGIVRLSDLFGRHDDLFMIHNMGTSCPHCTLWADGFNGIYDHIADRAAFVVSSPDRPAVQKTFAAGRGWVFPMVSHAGTTFARDMGYRSENGDWRPGLSVFKRANGTIVRVADTGMQPGDDFCAIWHMLDLLPDGANGWRPKFEYA